jgi:hypothetical protein
MPMSLSNRKIQIEVTMGFIRFSMLAVALLALLFSHISFCQGKVENPVNVKFAVERLNKRDYKIMVIVNIREPYKIVSPNSPDSITVKFGITFNDSTRVSFLGYWSETPAAIMELDPLFNQNLAVHERNVTLSRTIRLHKDDDFDAEGYMEFEAFKFKHDESGDDGLAIHYRRTIRIVRSRQRVTLMSK